MCFEKGMYMKEREMITRPRLQVLFRADPGS